MIQEIEKIVHRIKIKEIAGADETALACAGALIILARHSKAKTLEEFRWEAKEVTNRLVNARPSSSSLRNAVSHISREFEGSEGVELAEMRSLIENSASRLMEKIDDAKKRIAEIGSKRIRNSDVIFTHGFSTTVLAILKRVVEEGKSVQLFVTEARPGFGGREMAWRINDLGLPVTLIADSAARVFINGIDNILIGAEAIAVNGAVISKVGTAVIATLAHEARVRVLVAAGTYKFSPETVVGELVEIEEGDQAQIVDLKLLAKRENVHVRNPMYDVTPPQYVDAIITERGMIPPQGVYLILRQIVEDQN